MLGYRTLGARRGGVGWGGAAAALRQGGAAAATRRAPGLPHCPRGRVPPPPLLPAILLAVPGGRGRGLITRPAPIGGCRPASRRSQPLRSPSPRGWGRAAPACEGARLPRFGHGRWGGERRRGGRRPAGPAALGSPGVALPSSSAGAAVPGCARAPLRSVRRPARRSSPQGSGGAAAVPLPAPAAVAARGGAVARPADPSPGSPPGNPCPGAAGTSSCPPGSAGAWVSLPRPWLGGEGGVCVPGG